MGIDFTERCQVLFNRVVEYLLFSAWGTCAPVRRLYAWIAVLPKVSFVISRHLGTHKTSSLSEMQALPVGVQW